MTVPAKRIEAADIGVASYTELQAKRSINKNHLIIRGFRRILYARSWRFYRSDNERGLLFSGKPHALGVVNLPNQKDRLCADLQSPS
jgi:hypothetical protein